MTAKSQVTLLITNSIDYLADLLVARLGSDRVFRYNTDLWRDYAFHFSADGIEISDPTGRSVNDSDHRKGLPALFDARLRNISANGAD